MRSIHPFLSSCYQDSDIFLLTFDSQNKKLSSIILYILLMAALSTTFYHPLCTDNNHRTRRQASSRHGVRSMRVMSCRKQKLPEENEGVIQRTVRKMMSEAGKIGKNLKPEKKKGDVKDLMLMSISFAVYVYISQLLVCAYFSWQHLSFPNPSW
ncbi:hypothetical protein ISN44_As10g020600 [Arabidopsis suecica]|uniref:Uncharacterized protein n=1 Tax=Arabidopsis suecica TaxID=45249 RepID=A0A8T1ZZE6_ARASU|nr:hypothetical protein ISN44_As10g020600 [Arabidopsis suecica]